MSEATARATRRELRRAIGVHGTAVVQAHGQALNAQAQRVVEHEDRLNRFAARLTDLEADDVAHERYRVQQILKFGTLRGRLRWLVLGS